MLHRNNFARCILTDQASPKYSAFTIRYRRHAAVLDCYVQLRAIDDLAKLKVIAFFDTGAMISAISKECALLIGAEEIGSIRMRGFTGVELVPQYIVDVELPNQMEICTLVVAESKSLGANSKGEPYGFLIGIDILKFGDLALNHADGYTSLSFRIPSLNHVDYVEEYRRDFPDE